MKKLLLSAVMMTALFAACKKDDDDNGGGTATNQWKINGTTYTGITGGINASSGTLMGSGLSGTNGGFFIVEFNGTTFPATGGSFKIVTDTALDANDEVVVSAVVGTMIGGASYTSTGTDGKMATVTVTGGKVSVTVPEINAQNDESSEVIKVSGNITQP